MAHLIKNGMISFNAETPWHGLGTRVSQGATPEEMLSAAKMDWEVEMRSLAVSCTVDGRNAWCHQPMSGFKAVMRADTNEVFAVPTKRYKTVQNIEVARFFHDYADAASCELQVVGALEGGRKVWALAKVNADYTVSVDGDESDKQLGYVMLATSHDGSLRTIAMGTAIYVVCWNTMSAALSRVSGKNFRFGKTDASKAFFSLKHTSKFTHEAKQQAARTVGLVKEQLEQTSTMANLFASVSLDDKGRIEFVRRLIGGESYLEQVINDVERSASLLDAIVDEHDAKKMPEDTRLGKAIIESILTSPGNHLPSRKDTLWGAVNGVTYYADFERGRNQDSTLSGAWFGQGAQLKERAVNVAYDLAGVSR